MKSRSKELYDILREIDFFCDYVKQPKDNSKNLIIKHSKQLGDEFERAFKSVLSEIYGFKISHNEVKISNYICINPEKLSLDKNGYTVHDTIHFNEKFNIDTFINKYNFQSKNSYGITDIEEIKKCQQYLNNLLKKIDYSKFKPEKLIFNDIFIKYCYNNDEVLKGEIDLIIDNKIIDVKTDNEVKTIKKEYIRQLLFYYSFILLSSNLAKESENKISKIKIEKICIYYASFDYLLEFNLKDLINKEKEFCDIIYNEFFLVNYRLNDVINIAVSKKIVVNDYFSKIEFDINDKKILILKYYINGFNKRMLKLHGYSDNYENLRLKNFNLYFDGIHKYYEIGHLTKKEFRLILKYLFNLL